MKNVFLVLLFSVAMVLANDTDSADLADNDIDIIIENNGNDTVSQNDTLAADTVNGGAPLPKRITPRFNAAGFGPANLQNLGSEKIAYNFYGGRFWEVTNYAAIRALGETTTDFDQSFLLGINLGVNIYPLTTDISPYVGGDMGFGFSRSGNDNTVGLSFAGSAGFLFFRKSNVQLNAELRAYVLLDETGSGYPANYVARLGIHF